MLTRVHILILNLVLALQVSNTTQTKDGEDDIKECLKENKGLKAYKFLPGRGWDGLQNEEMFPVLNYSYELCQVSPDGLYFIPDQIRAMPQSKSTYSEAKLIDSYLDYISSTAKKLNADPGLIIKSIAPSGSFSEEFLQIKKKYRDLGYSVVTIIAEVRAQLYLAKVKDPVLSLPFKMQLEKIASAIKEKAHDLAAQEAGVLVRDFGTHVINKVYAGAGIKAMIYLNKDQFSTLPEDIKNSIVAKTTTQLIDEFKAGNLKKAHLTVGIPKDFILDYKITTLNGERFDASLTLGQWLDNVSATTMTVIDRQGLPLHGFIKSYMLSDEAARWFTKVIEVIQDAVETYYGMNTIKGCIDPSFPNFNPSANVGDNSCSEVTVNLTFGGFYKTCEQSKKMADDVCSYEENRRIVNPKTKNASCPSGFYNVSVVHRDEELSLESLQCEIVRPAPLFFPQKSCTKKVSKQNVRTAFYWCSAFLQTPKTDGYLFGGFFSQDSANPLTGDRTCPEHFWEHRFIGDTSICLSTEFPKVKQVYQLGGFFSCDFGNPLAVKSGESKLNDPSSIGTIITFPKRCPEGYSQHMLTVVKDCKVYYCVVRLGHFEPTYVIQRPPFTEVIVRAKTGASTSEVLGKPFVSQGVAVAYGVLGTLIVIGLIGAFGLGAFVLVKNGRQEHDGNRQKMEPLLTQNVVTEELANTQEDRQEQEEQEKEQEEEEEKEDITDDFINEGTGKITPV